MRKLSSRALPAAIGGVSIVILLPVVGLAAPPKTAIPSERPGDAANAAPLANDPGLPQNDAMSESPPPVLNQINLVVKDLPASIAFYRRLGVTVEDPGPPEWARHHATVLMPGGIRLELDSEAFARQWNPGWKGRAGGAGCVLFFGVSSRDQVDRVFESVTAAGFAVEKPPDDAFWGARYAIVEDPTATRSAS